MRRRHLIRLALLGLIALTSIGCGNDIDTTYGRTRGQSINGTGALAEILRGRGHDVRVAVRANEILGNWADVIVRFDPSPGPIDRKQAAWLSEWLNARPNRRLIYIPRDYTAEPEFWDAMLAALPKGADPVKIKKIEARRKNSQGWVSELPPKTKTPADSAAWFEFEPTPKAPTTCKTLEGPWSVGVDPIAATVTKHDVFKVLGGEEILLSGDGSPFAISWTCANQSRVLVVANASFLLNASFLNHARRPLAKQVIDWVGTKPVHVAFVEGQRVSINNEDDQAGNQSQFRLLNEAPFGWLAVHFGVFLVLFAFSLAFRLGRASPEAASGVERPSAHPEALGAMFARTRRVDAARFLLESYRRWRYPTAKAGRSAPNSTSPTTPSPIR